MVALCMVLCCWGKVPILDVISAIWERRAGTSGCTCTVVRRERAWGEEGWRTGGDHLGWQAGLDKCYPTAGA